VLSGYEDIVLHHVQLIAKHLQHFNQTNKLPSGTPRKCISQVTCKITAIKKELSYNRWTMWCIVSWNLINCCTTV